MKVNIIDMFISLTDSNGSTAQISVEELKEALSKAVEAEKSNEG